MTNFKCVNIEPTKVLICLLFIKQKLNMSHLATDRTNSKEKNVFGNEVIWLN
uniref:Uncharacterized protein n=1 Tax=Anguilla anguilla TaxID=7936 RepID=A0A0E9WZG3_ANGAN